MIISVIVPVYCNQDSLYPLFDKLNDLRIKLKTRCISLDLIFVDDGSTDSSFEKLIEYKKKLPDTRIIKFTKNFGAPQAARAAIKLVKGDAFTFISADLQDPPELIIDMILLWMDGNKFIICERESREDSLFSKLFSKIFYILLRILVISDYPKGGFDMALMDKCFLLHMDKAPKGVLIPIIAFCVGYKPKIIKYHRPKRIGGKSKWTFIKRFNAFLDIILGFSIAPIRSISIFGIFISCISFLYGFTVATRSIIFGSEVPGFTTIITLITFLIGILILMMGIIGEYIWKIYQHTNDRAEYIIEDIAT
jgi:dolichol-phosphate mannosyltransferase